jgi:hypothetical protein
MNFLIDHFMLILTHFSIFSSIDLSNIAAAVYSTELCNRLRIFLSACPPSSPQPHVNELLIAIADFERDLELWNIRLVIEKNTKYVLVSSRTSCNMFPQRKLKMKCH